MSKKLYLQFFLHCCLTILMCVCVEFNEGDNCVFENQEGKCTNLENCEYGKILLKSGRKPQHCGFIGKIPIVCCPKNMTEALTATVVGKKSTEKCLIYNERVFEAAFANGIKTEPREFPHMAILGYGEDQNVEWLCGGSLIDVQFILTAAHCLRSQQFGDLKFIRLGELDIKNDTEDARPEDYRVAATFPHPNYTSTQHYYDIALVKLDRAATLSRYVRPACLHLETNVSIDQIFIGTGWGKTSYFGDTSSHLLKGDLKYVDHTRCSKAYPPSKKLTSGILDETQICAGNSDGKDTCPGDSGGPLQIKKPADDFLEVRYEVVGITSFGKACGIGNTVGVYTRVSQFIRWIEEILWSNWKIL